MRDTGSYTNFRINFSQTYKTFTELPSPDLSNGIFIYSEEFVEKLGSELTLGDHIYETESEYVTLGELTSSSDTYAYYKAPFCSIQNYNTVMSTYAMMFGKGYSNNRKNIQTLDWSGNGWYAGDVFVKGTDQNTNAKRLATEEYVFSNFARASTVST